MTSIWSNTSRLVSLRILYLLRVMSRNIGRIYADLAVRFSDLNATAFVDPLDSHTES